MGRGADLFPRELGASKGLQSLGIRHVSARKARKPGELPPAALRHQAPKLGEVIGKVLEWAGGGPLLPHEQQRGRRVKQQDGRSDTVSIEPDLVVQPVAEGAIADLVMVLDAMDECLVGNAVRRGAAVP